MKTDVTTKNTEDKNLTIHNIIILDASGSMSSIYDQALAGVNETINTIRKAKADMPEQNQVLSLGSFADGLRIVYNGTAIERVGKFGRTDYSTQGSTALYDAMGEMLTSERRSVKQGDKVLVTIITDGYENSSRKWDAESIKQLVDELRKEDWVFTYIGANQDVEEAASTIGVQNTYQFEATVEGTIEMFEREGRARRNWNERVYRGEEDLDTGYFEEDAEAAAAPDRVTPARIDSLRPNEIFVFGSNIAGQHTGGAAQAAVQRFGARMGQANGPQGQSYAIPTVGCCYNETYCHVQEFILYALKHPELHFLVTPIGCGNGGWDPQDMARFFLWARDVQNISLPISFRRVLNGMRKDTSKKKTTWWERFKKSWQGK